MLPVETVYLIPYDSSIEKPDDYAKNALQESIRAALTALLARPIGSTAYELKIEELLSRIIKVWFLWEDSEAKRNIRRATRQYIGKVFKYLTEKIGIGYSSGTEGFLIGPVADHEAKQKLLRVLESK